MCPMFSFPKVEIQNSRAKSQNVTQQVAIKALSVLRVEAFVVKEITKIDGVASALFYKNVGAHQYAR